ncbi:MAG TPA: MFS transporter [Candidatus Limnocylindrales bacterium]
MNGFDAPLRPASLVTPAFVALASATLAFFIAGGIVLPVSPGFARNELGAGDLGAGVAIGSFSVAALILRPVVGWSSDRFGRRPLLVGGSLLAVAALALHLVANELATFIAARALLGAGEGFFLVAALAAASDIAPEERRGEALSFLSLSLYLGLAIGPPVAAWLFSGESYAVVWLVAMAIAALAAALSFIVPESAPAVLERAEHGGAQRARAPLIHPAGLFPGFVILLGLTGMAGFLTFMPLYGPRFGFENGGLPLTVYALIVVALRVVGATWPDRFGAGRLSSIALGVSAAGLALIGLVPTTIGLIAGTAIFASGVAFTMPALLSLAVSRVAPEERGTVVGTTTVFLDLAFGIGPVVLGAVAARSGYGVAFVVAGASAAFGCALLLSRRSASGRSVAAPTG